MLYSETLSPDSLENVFRLITSCIKVASLYGGRLFGGFVRGVVVPRMLDSTTRVHYKDVDLWFLNKDNVDAFIRAMGADLVPAHVGSGTLNVTERIYKFAREQYHLVKDGVTMAWIDVVISPTIPVNDFNVNTLTVRYTNSGAQIFESFGSDGIDTLIDAIHDRKAVMLPDYIPLLCNNGYSLVHSDRIKQNYLDHQWTITYGDLTVPSDAGVRWYRTNLQSSNSSSTSVVIPKSESPKPESPKPVVVEVPAPTVIPMTPLKPEVGPPKPVVVDVPAPVVISMTPPIPMKVPEPPLPVVVEVPAPLVTPIIGMDPSKPVGASNSTIGDGSMDPSSLVINECLSVAGNHNGVVFGGYLRGVIVARLGTLNLSVPSETVDLWFTTQEQANAFINEMGSRLISQLVPKGVNRKQDPIRWKLMHNGTEIVWVYITVSETIPVTDLNVNNLVGRYQDGKFEFDSCGPEPISVLLGYIFNKTAVLLSSYKSSLTGDKRAIHQKHLNEKYLNKGWTLIYDGKKLPSNITDTWCMSQLSIPMSQLSIPMSQLSIPMSQLSIPITSSVARTQYIGTMPFSSQFNINFI